MRRRRGGGGRSRGRGRGRVRRRRRRRVGGNRRRLAVGRRGRRVGLRRRRLMAGHGPGAGRGGARRSAGILPRRIAGSLHFSLASGGGVRRRTARLIGVIRRTVGRAASAISRRAVVAIGRRTGIVATPRPVRRAGLSEPRSLILAIAPWAAIGFRRPISARAVIASRLAISVAPAVSSPPVLGVRRRGAAGEGGRGDQAEQAEQADFTRHRGLHDNRGRRSMSDRLPRPG